MRIKYCLPVLILLAISMALPAKDLVFNTYNTSNSKTGYSELNDTAISPDGLIMTVWCEVEVWNAGQNRIQATVYNTKTKTMSKVITIPGQFGDNIWPRVAAGEDGEFFVTWAQLPTSTEGGHNRTILFAHYKNGAFAKIETVQNGSGDFPVVHYNPKLKETGVYYELTLWNPLDLEDTVRYRSAKGVWSDPYIFGHHTYGAERMEVATDDNGVEYVAYEQKIDIPPHEVIEAYYTNTRGGRWRSVPIQMTNNGAWTMQPNVAVRPDGLEVLYIFFSYAEHNYYSVTITYSSKNDTEGKYSSPKFVTEGPWDHKFYDSGLQYHGDRFYFSYNDDGQIKYRTYYKGSWSAPIVIPKSETPRMCHMSASPYVGIAVAWFKRDGVNPPESMMSFADYAVAKRIRIYPVASASRSQVREQSLFFQNNYNVVNWINSSDNIVDGVNTAVKFLLYRSESNTFSYTTPYKTFVAATPGDGFEIVESNKQYRFTESIGRSELSKTYQYAVIAVDEEGNKSDPVVATLQ